MVRRYEGAVELPPNLDLDFLQEVVAFLCENANIAEQRAAIKTTEGSLDETRLAHAVAAIEPGEEVLAITVTLIGPEYRFAQLRWGPLGATVSLRSSQRIELLGVVEALRQLVTKAAAGPAVAGIVDRVDLDPRAVRQATEGRWRRRALGGRMSAVERESDRGPGWVAEEPVARSVRCSRRWRRPRWSRVRAWWYGNRTALYVEVVSGIVVAALVALWAFVF